MIYMKTKAGKHLLILEPANLDRVRRGEPATSPDKEVMVAYTPDVPWLTDKLSNVIDPQGGLDTEQLDRLLKEGMKNPPLYDRPYHGDIDIMKGKHEPT